MNSREPATHSCPAVLNPAQVAPLTAWDRSASAKITSGDLPPNSRLTRFRLLLAAACITLRPTSVDPVKAILSIPILAVIAAPVGTPGPVTILTTPSGRPASSMISPKRRADRGVSSAGLRIAVFPHASAGASFQAHISSGKFQGMINPTTPIGSRKE